MNFSTAIRRHEDQARHYARLGKAKAARAHLLRAGQLRMAMKIKSENRQTLRQKLVASLAMEA